MATQDSSKPPYLTREVGTSAYPIGAFALQVPMNYAVKVAEGNPNNFGVLSEPVSRPEDAEKILNKSIRNNYYRWLDAHPLKDEAYVDHMQKRWAPIGAKNDPKNLNVNWAKNVRAALRKKLGEKEFKRWQDMRLAMLDQQERGVA